MGVRGLQVNLLSQFALQIGDNTPDLFLVDIQQDQVEGLKAFLSERGIAAVTVEPTAPTVEDSFMARMGAAPTKAA